MLYHTFSYDSGGKTMLEALKKKSFHVSLIVSIVIALIGVSLAVYNGHLLYYCGIYVGNTSLLVAVENGWCICNSCDKCRNRLILRGHI